MKYNYKESVKYYINCHIKLCFVPAQRLIIKNEKLLLKIPVYRKQAFIIIGEKRKRKLKLKT